VGEQLTRAAADVEHTARRDAGDRERRARETPARGVAAKARPRTIEQTDGRALGVAAVALAVARTVVALELGAAKLRIGNAVAA